MLQPLKPEEIQEIFAREIDPEFRMGTRLGSHYPKYKKVQKFLEWAMDRRIMSRELYTKIINHPFSFTEGMAAKAMPEIIKMIGEVDNSAAILQMYSNAAGGKRLKDGRVVPVMKTEVGMDDESIHHMIKSPTIRVDYPWEYIANLLALLKRTQEQEGLVETKELADFLRLERKFRRLAQKQMDGDINADEWLELVEVGNKYREAIEKLDPEALKLLSEAKRAQLQGDMRRAAAPTATAPTRR